MNYEHLVDSMYDWVKWQLENPTMKNYIVVSDEKTLVVRIANKLRQDKIYVCVIDELPEYAKQPEDKDTPIFQLITVKKEYNGKE